MFRSYAKAVEEGREDEAYTELRREFCDEAPTLITLELLTLDSAIKLLMTLDDRIKEETKPNKGGTDEERLRNFLTAAEEQGEDREDA